MKKMLVVDGGGDSEKTNEEAFRIFYERKNLLLRVFFFKFLLC